MDDYLTPRDDGAPSGENLEYDPVFTALMLVAQPGEEKQAGTEIISAAEPDYRAVAEKALVVLDRSHDLRAAVLLANARLRTDGLGGFAEVLGYIRRVLEAYWDTCHPQLDPDDDDDPTMRVNAVLGLAEQGSVLRGLRLTPLTDSQSFGRFGLRDIAIAEGEIAAPEDMTNVPDTTSVGAAFRDTPSATLERYLANARTALAEVQGIDKVFVDRLGSFGPDLGPLEKLLRKAVARLAEAVGEPEGGAAADEAGAEPGDSSPRPSGAPGSINGPRDVQAALDRIISYYSTHEPSSPLPILLLRARRLVGADFMTIMQDIAPGGLETVRMLGGMEEED